jgi:DNA-binding response OmpR family regulator
MKILAVEDEPHIMRLVQVNLERAGYQVITASCAVEALVIAIREQPELIVMDLTLPDIAGDALARILRRLRSQKSTSLLLMCPKRIEASWLQGWIEPVNAYITKPFSPQELVSFVRRILQARQTSATQNQGQESV